jgi:hypothetical protein
MAPDGRELTCSATKNRICGSVQRRRRTSEPARRRDLSVGLLRKWLEDGEKVLAEVARLGWNDHVGELIGEETENSVVLGHRR